MSWSKRGAAPAPDPAPYGAPQPYGNQQGMYPNYAANNTVNQAQQQFWQPPPQPQLTPNPQQYAQVYQPADYGTNNVQYQQYNQNYTNQAYSTNTQGYPQNYYANQPATQTYPQPAHNQPTQNKDDWGDWDWDRGWDESKGQVPPQQQQHSSLQQQQQPQQFNNANVIEESFASTNSWNWNTEDKSIANPPAVEPHPPPQSPPQPQPPHPLAQPLSESSVQEPVHNTTDAQNTSNVSTHSSAAAEVTTLNDKEIVKERLPNLALGKRFHLDNLTPQWSIESQMSQESSDGVQTHSESTYMSENQSRNSNSSPGLNLEHYNSHSLEESPQNIEWSRQSTDNLPLTNNTQQHELTEDHVQLTNSLQEMNLSSRGSINLDSLGNQPSQEQARAPHENSISSSTSQASLPHPSHPPAPANVPLPPVSAAGMSLPPSFPSGAQNPFKNAGLLSHKSTSKVPSSSAPCTSQYPPMPVDSTNLTSPAAVNMVQHGRPPTGFGANLETTPDNSERPDHPQVPVTVRPTRPSPVPQPPPDNLEIAPRNDRNEYLQTAHLSSSDYGENTDFSRNMPLSSLRRMVVGQQESEYGQAGGDEPPPGLARMVPGQQTEAEDFPQPGDAYLERLVVGQTEGARQYRQPDGQPGRSRPRPRVPGERSLDDYQQYQGSGFDAADQRVVPGLDRYGAGAGAGQADVREQNMDGSEYTEPAPRTSRSVLSARDGAAELPMPADFAPGEERQRELTMEGENLQDLSAVSAAADLSAAAAAAEDRKTDMSDSLEMPATSSRRQSRNHTSDESERNRTYDASPRRDRDRDRERDKRKSSRDKERDGRHAREERRGERGERGERRSGRGRRYDTEDTDYNSDRERDSRRYREGSYAGKPPRGDKDRRREGEPRRGGTLERRRDRDRDELPRDRRERSDRDEPPRDRRERSDRHERRYRDIDPSRRHGTRAREHEDDFRRRVVTFAGDTAGNMTATEREGAGEASPGRERDQRTDDEAPRRRDRRTRHTRHDPYYEEYGAGAGVETDPYLEQRRRYQYYEQLRRSDPARYLRVYEQLMAQQLGHATLGHVAHVDDRASLHSGHSSSNLLAGNHSYYLERRGGGFGGGRAVPSDLATDLSDRELPTDASLTLQFDESVRSERMTPFKFSTAHVKGSLSSRGLVVVAAAYPVDGQPARVLLLEAAARDPATAELSRYPGPLVPGVTHKRTVIEYCLSRARGDAGAGARDAAGRCLIWKMLALMLAQNGCVPGADLAELLMKNQSEFEYSPPAAPPPPPLLRSESRRGSSSVSGRSREPTPSPPLPPRELAAAPEAEAASGGGPAGERAALQRLRDCLLTGDQYQALECAMSGGLWGHALSLAAGMPARAAAAVRARFLAALLPRDPLHTLHAARAGVMPPAAACVADARWGDWRPHVAMLLANPSLTPELDQRTLLQFGDSLSSRGEIFGAQFCYLGAGLRPAAHPLAPFAPAPAPAPAAEWSPPRLSLLLSDGRARSLLARATNEAIFATEILEYALALPAAAAAPAAIPELQAYKLVLATRLADAGLPARALAVVEQLARVLTAASATARYPRALLHAVATLADRLQYHDPLAAAGGATPAWLRDLMDLDQNRGAGVSAHSTPQHAGHVTHAGHVGDSPAPPLYNPLPSLTDSQPPSYEPQSMPYNSQPTSYDAQPTSYDSQLTSYDSQLTSYDSQPTSYDPQPTSYDWQQEHSPALQQQSPPAAPPQYFVPAPAPAADQSGDAAGYGWQGGDHYSYGEESPQSIRMPGQPAAAGGGAGAGLYRDQDEPQHDREPAPQHQRNQQQGDHSDESGGGKAAAGRGKEGEGRGAGWLGGILTKLSLRAPNQMILPDDKNPTIVWDAEKKRWKNLDGGEEEDRPPPPPPRIMPTPVAAPPSGDSGAGTPANVLRMQKGRLKNSYVDVFNPSGRAASTPAGPAPPAPAAPLPAPPHYFVPSPAPAPAGDEQVWRQ